MDRDTLNMPCPDPTARRGVATPPGEVARHQRRTRKGARPAAALVAAAAAAALLLSAGSATAQTRLGIEIGAEPEPLTLETVDGEAVDLSRSFGHRPVLLEFWATWCPRCEALEPRILEAYETYGDRVDFYGVAVAVNQDLRRIRRHLEAHPLPFPMLWDAKGKATRRFMAPTTSYVVILDAAGRVAYTGVDAEQEISAALAEIVGEETESTGRLP